RLGMQYTIVSSQGVYATSESWSTAAPADAVFAALAGPAGPPPPNITSLSPASGPVGTSVTITGTNFGASQGASGVTFNGFGATVNSWSDTSIVAIVPGPTSSHSGANTGPVVVTVGGVASNSVTFTVIPTINSLTPSSGPIGTAVSVSGSGFGLSQGTSTV